MDPKRSAQDVLRCHLCETPAPARHCDTCLIDLCKDCVEKHLSGQSGKHKVVPFERRKNTPKCMNHSSKQSEVYCKECNIPLCTLCVSSEEHLMHDMIDLLKGFESKKSILQNDLQEFEKSIYPRYQAFASSISVQKAYLHQNSQKLKTAINKRGEDLHREIDTIVKKLESDLDEMDSKCMSALSKQEHEITRTISEITKNIEELKKLLDFNDASLVFAYKSMNAEFRTLPPQFIVSLPRFTHQTINGEQIHQQVGSLSLGSINTENHGLAIGSSDANCTLDRLLSSVPKIITAFSTKKSNSVSCLTDDEIWICGDGNNLTLYNLRGEQLESIKTESLNKPQDIAVTRSGDLVYTDYIDKSANIVINSRVQRVFRLGNWKPDCVCCTASGDLLVVIYSYDDKLTKVVRFSNSVEKQKYQNDEEGKPLYSTSPIKFITENRNQDVCVSDSGAQSVVVVSAAGGLRFTYTGPPSTTRGSFDPRGIATDSHGWILTADFTNHCIHILDRDGQFLRFIDNCDLQLPYGLCVDSKDNLFVTEDFTGKVKKIQYYM